MSEEVGASKAFDISKYQVLQETQAQTVTIPETGESFEIQIKEMTWAKRNQLISTCINWNKSGNTSFDGDKYVRESLKEIIVEAPWGRTTEAFLVSIVSRLGAALEAVVPNAFEDATGDDVPQIKKE